VQPKSAAATVGVAEHSNSAVLVTVAPDGELLDRRRINLTDRKLPTHPHHHEGSWAVGRYLNVPGARVLSLAEAVALVERVGVSAACGARESLEALAAAVPIPIARIAMRACPTLPPTIAERIADNRAQTVADSVMYRQALAAAAEARGWFVYWYDRERAFRDAAAVLGREEINAFLSAMLGLDDLMFFVPEYTSVSRVRASRNGTRSLVSINETGHLRFANREAH